MSKELKIEREVAVRFSEVDSLGIVWHGHHIKYFEDGREAFGKAFGLGYMDVYSHGYSIPLTVVHCDYKRPIEYEKDIVVETKYIPTLAAKIIFEYTIRDKVSRKTLATGKTEQVFLDKNRELQFINPDFYEAWKEKHGVLISFAKKS